MNDVSLKIEKPIWDSSAFNVTLKIPGLTFAKIKERVDSFESHRLFDGEEGEWQNYEPFKGRLWISLTNDTGNAVITIHGGFTHDDPDDALDGMNEPTELSLSDRLEVAALVRRIIAE